MVIGQGITVNLDMTKRMLHYDHRAFMGKSLKITDNSTTLSENAIVRFKFCCGFLGDGQLPPWTTNHRLIPQDGRFERHLVNMSLVSLAGSETRPMVAGDMDFYVSGGSQSDWLGVVVITQNPTTLSVIFSRNFFIPFSRMVIKALFIDH